MECNVKINLSKTTFKSCGDLGVNVGDILTSPIHHTTNVKEFKDLITSELINVKCWKTMSDYPTLKLLYNRYINSTDYTNIMSSQFTYTDMMNFSNLVGTYWVDLIEQVIPSTTIWGSTYVYGNTVFDQQKFKYKEYTLFTCETPNYNHNVVSPVNSFTTGVTVETNTLKNIEYYDSVSGSTTGATFGQNNNLNIVNKCEGVGIIQSNCGSEFIGKIVEITNETTGGTETIIIEN